MNFDSQTYFALVKINDPYANWLNPMMLPVPDYMRQDLNRGKVDWYDQKFVNKFCGDPCNTKQYERWRNKQAREERKRVQTNPPPKCEWLGTYKFQPEIDEKRESLRRRFDADVFEEAMKQTEVIRYIIRGGAHWQMWLMQHQCYCVREQKDMSRGKKRAREA